MANTGGVGGPEKAQARARRVETWRDSIKSLLGMVSVIPTYE